YLEPTDVGERSPRVIDAAKEGDWHDDHAEDEADLLGLDVRADGETERSGEQAGEDHDGDKKPPVGDVREDRRAGDVVGQGEDHGGGEDALDGGEDDLLDGDGADGEGAHDAVVDFAGNAELLRERESDGSDAGEH